LERPSTSSVQSAWFARNAAIRVPTS
jgi:hypothetical protein